MKGCEDHILSLMSKDYEAFLVGKSSADLLVPQRQWTGALVVAVHVAGAATALGALRLHAAATGLQEVGDQD